MRGPVGALLCGFVLACALPVAASALPPGAVPDGVPRVPHVTHPVAHTAKLPYGGGAVMHANRTHLVFWLPAGAGLSFDPGYVALFERFLTDVAHDSHAQTNVYSLTGQYADDSGPAAYSSSYAGAILDTDPLPTRDAFCQEPPAPPLGEGPGWKDCVTDDQIQTEVSRVAAAHHIPATLQDITSSSRRLAWATASPLRCPRAARSGARTTTATAPITPG